MCESACVCARSPRWLRPAGRWLPCPCCCLGHGAMGLAPGSPWQAAGRGRAPPCCRQTVHVYRSRPYGLVCYIGTM
eukprot:7001967-Prymnesium_polylepis.1